MVTGSACPTCGRALGAAGGAHGCATVATVANVKGQIVYQKWIDPTQSKDYCWLCHKIHRNHAGVAVVCVWAQAESKQGRRMPASVGSFDQVAVLLASGMIFDPLSKEGKREILARKQGTTTVQATVVPTGVCVMCGNGPLDGTETAANNTCRACWPQVTVMNPTLPRILTCCHTCNVNPAPVKRHSKFYCASCAVAVDQASVAAAASYPTAAAAQPRVPLVPGAGRRPRVTVGQGKGETPPVATVSAPVDGSAETPAARKARILAALKAK